jgi:hypothetical protein
MSALAWPTVSSDSTSSVYVRSARTKICIVGRGWRGSVMARRLGLRPTKSQFSRPCQKAVTTKRATPYFLATPISTDFWSSKAQKIKRNDCITYYDDVFILTPKSEYLNSTSPTATKRTQVTTGKASKVSRRTIPRYR